MIAAGKTLVIKNPIRLKKTNVFIFLLYCVLSGCGESSLSTIDSKPKLPAPSVSAVPMNDNIPVVRSPEASEPVPKETLQTYQWYCAQCHGIEGKGDGINAKYVTVPPRDHTKAAYLETRSDEDLFQAIKLGGLKVGRAPCMPSWQHTLDDDMIRSLVQYIRELCSCKAI